MNAAAGHGGAVGVYGRVPFFDVLDFAFRVDDERGAVGEAEFLVQDPIEGGDGTLTEVAGQGEAQVQLLRPVAEGGKVVCADANYDCAGILKFGETSLVRREFLRSTTCEGRGKERQDDGLAAVFGQLEGVARRGLEREVGRAVADFQVGLGRLNRLGPDGCGQCQPQ